MVVQYVGLIKLSKLIVYSFSLPLSISDTAERAHARLPPVRIVSNELLIDRFCKVSESVSDVYVYFLIEVHARPGSIYCMVHVLVHRLQSPWAIVGERGLQSPLLTECLILN